MVNEYIETVSSLSVVRNVLLQTGLQVSPKVPSTIPPEGIIRIQRMGGGMRNLVTDEALIAVRVYAPTDLEAEAICNECRSYLRKAQFEKHGPGWIRYWRESGGPGEFPDPDVQGFVRWQFTGILGVATK